KNESHGKADVFLVTDGVMSDTCLSRVRIAKLPRSASTVPGLATLSWLRANRTLYDMARPSLGSAAAASFVTPTILADVDTATASVGNLVPSFDLGGKGTPLTKTARQSDRLLTGILRAGQKVGDAGFASACAGWIQAMAKAKDANDASLGAAEATYAKAVLGASGSSAQSVAKFSVACGSVTSAGVAAAAVLIGGGAVPASGVIDAQAAANAICGATVNTTTVVTGVTALATGAMTPGTGTTTYGKTLLTGSAKNAASAITNYGRVNLPTAKLWGCPDPSLKGAVDTAITVIVVGGHITQMAPEVCLPDVTAQAAPHPVSSTTTTTLPSVGRCDEQQVAGGDTADTRNIELGKTSGTATLDYNTFSIKDRIIVSYQGSVLFDTGCVGTSASQPINFAGSSTQLTVEVMPNCEGGTTGTAWQYTVHCPP